MRRSVPRDQYVMVLYRARDSNLASLKIDGMKTRNDGPGYTTRATSHRPTTCS